MKKILRFSFFIFSFSFLAVPAGVAQTTQQGRVVLQSSGGRTLPGVQVMAYDAAPADTDGEGRFSLTFPGKSAGDLVPLKEVYKRGYELVNRRQTERWILSPSEMVIVMAEAGKLREAREKYYGIGNSRYVAQYEAAVAEIENLKKQNRLTGVQYQNRLDEAYTLLDNSQKRLEEYADRFSRINRDELSEMERQAFALVDEGRLEEAITLYESQNLMAQLAETGSARDMAEGEWREMVSSLMFNADIYIFAGGRENLAKAGGIYLAIVEADPADYDNLVTYGRFLKETLDFAESVKWLEKAVENAPTHPQVAEALLLLGETYMQARDYDPAVKYTLRSIELFDAQVKAGEAAGYYAAREAFAYVQLASSYYGTKSIDNAAAAIAAGNVLNESYPVTDSLSYIKNKSYLDGVAMVISLQNVVNNFAKNYEADIETEALDAIANIKRLVAMEDNIENRAVLATSITYLGGSYIMKSAYDKALASYLEALEIEEELFRRNPLMMLLNLATTHNSLATVYSNKGDTAKAEEHRAAALEMREEAYEMNPKAFTGELASSYYMYGNVYGQEGRLDKAAEYLTRSIELYESVPAEYGNSVAMELCSAMDDLGLVMKAAGRLDEAQEILKRALAIADTAQGIDMTTIIMNVLSHLVQVESTLDTDEWADYAWRNVELWAENMDILPLLSALTQVETSVETEEYAAAENYRILALALIEDYIESNPGKAPDTGDEEWNANYVWAQKLGQYYDGESEPADEETEMAHKYLAKRFYQALITLLKGAPQKKENKYLIYQRAMAKFNHGAIDMMVFEEYEAASKYIGNAVSDMQYVKTVADKDEKATIDELINDFQEILGAIVIMQMNDE